MTTSWFWWILWKNYCQVTKRIDKEWASVGPLPNRCRKRSNGSLCSEAKSTWNLISECVPKRRQAWLQTSCWKAKTMWTDPIKVAMLDPQLNVAECLPYRILLNSQHKFWKDSFARILLNSQHKFWGPSLRLVCQLISRSLEWTCIHHTEIFLVQISLFLTSRDVFT